MRYRYLTPLLIILSSLNPGCKKDELTKTETYDCHLPFTDSSADHTKHLQYRELIEGISQSGVPGIMMAVYVPENGLWTGTAGKADLKAGIDMQPCQITRVGSTVKTFTATIIFLLQEEGKLSLDDKVNKYLSESQLRGIENADKATIRQLLNHSSGIYNYIQNLKFQTASLNDLIKEWRPEELISYARGQKAFFEPEEDVLYSNTNYILLGMIITEIEGKPFYEVFEEKIFAPLDMRFTKFAAKDPVPDNIVRGYIDFYSNLNVINATYYSGWDYYTADGGLISNAYDLNIFLTALLDGRIISKKSLQEMTDWKKPLNSDETFFPLYYGAGLFKMVTPWGDAYFHSGDAIGYYANMVYFPDHKTTITWAANGNYGKIDQYTSSKSAIEDIFRAVFE